MISHGSFGQDAIERIALPFDLNCKLDHPSLTSLFKKGLYALQDEDLTSIAGQIFFNITQEFPDCCDAYYYTGQALELQNKHQTAFSFYYMADSLAQSSSVKFKDALAKSSLRIHNINFAREKYAEIIEQNPTSSVGHFGFAVTATSLGDFQEGIEHLSLAQQLLDNDPKEDLISLSDIKLVQGVLLINLKEYTQAWEALQQCSDTNKSTDVFLINSALCALELYNVSGNQHWKIKALEHFSLIENKNQLDEQFKDRFIELD